MNNSYEILDVLLQYIQKNGTTEKQCLIDCNINTSFLTDWKGGRLKNPSYDKIVKLAKYLNIDLNLLFLGEENQTNEQTVDEPEQKKIKNVDNKEQAGAKSSSKNVSKGNTYHGTANIAIGDGIRQLNLNMGNEQSSRSSDTDKIVQELDEMMHSLDDEEQREALASQVRSNIQTFKLLLGTSKKKQN